MRIDAPWTRQPSADIRDLCADEIGHALADFERWRRLTQTSRESRRMATGRR
jgi:hypothetical protein